MFTKGLHHIIGKVEVHDNFDVANHLATKTQREYVQKVV